MEDRIKIQELIAHFANSFDVKDWDGLQSCFTESIYTDYSDLRGTPPETISVREYVRLRRESLDPLKIQHLVSNYEIKFLDSTTASCRASMVVWRKTDKEDFITHCVYMFQLVAQETDWKISGITQKVLWNEGTSSIYKGAKS
jgi:3-phenylpropionate/cinnamic acid dioxygenase small subunit